MSMWCVAWGRRWGKVKGAARTPHLGWSLHSSSRHLAISPYCKIKDHLLIGDSDALHKTIFFAIFLFPSSCEITVKKFALVKSSKFNFFFLEILSHTLFSVGMLGRILGREKDIKEKGIQSAKGWTSEK